METKKPLPRQRKSHRDEENEKQREISCEGCKWLSFDTDTANIGANGKPILGKCKNNEYYFIIRYCRCDKYEV